MPQVMKAEVFEPDLLANNLPRRVERAPAGAVHAAGEPQGVIGPALDMAASRPCQNRARPRLRVRVARFPNLFPVEVEDFGQARAGERQQPDCPGVRLPVPVAGGAEACQVLPTSGTSKVANDPACVLASFDHHAGTI